MVVGIWTDKPPSAFPQSLLLLLAPTHLSEKVR